jgi:two-component system, NtrC family, sensor histidine kinase HydH
MRVPLKVQIGAVVALFVAALASLWTTGASVMARERRWSSAGDVLTRAGVALAGRGEAILANAPHWPYDLGPDEWDDLDSRLSEISASALAPFDGVEGGYFLRDHKRFLGASFPTEPAKKKGRDRRGQQGPPPRERDLIEIQSDAAIRRNQPFSVVADVPPSTVAIRTAPVLVDGEAIAATWTMTRLVDPIFIDRSVRGYRLSAGLALGGIALALLLTLNLARTVSRQRVERDRLQAELRRSERLAALGKLLAGVAHEVRNPLAGIRSTAQLWQRGIGPDAESFEDLLSEVDRLDGIVERLLHFSRADAREMFPSDLNALAAEAARLATPSAESHQVQIQLDLAASLPPALMAPPAVLQILRNLTANAIQAMPDGGVLRIATRLDSSRRRVEVEVADTGQGLSIEALEHLFEPFFTTKPSGTGLGLAIAREIALAHHGELRAGPRPGGPGASFTLALPVAEPDAKSERDLDGDLD